MFDIESVRIEKLIDERIQYENAFFIVEDMSKSRELDFTISRFLDMEFKEPDDELFEKMRDEGLIVKREAYESEYFRNFDYPEVEKDLLDYLAESYEEDIVNDFFHDDFLLDCHVKSPVAKKPCCGCGLEYMPNEDVFDDLACIYCPEGPNENLEAILYRL